MHLRTTTLSRLEGNNLSLCVGISANVKILFVVFKNPTQLISSQLLQQGLRYL